MIRQADKVSFLEKDYSPTWHVPTDVSSNVFLLCELSFQIMEGIHHSSLHREQFWIPILPL
jgi:hypothetical protein